MEGYKKHGKKAPSLAQVYQLSAADVFRRGEILYHVSSYVNLPPPPDAGKPIYAGLPNH